MFKLSIQNFLTKNNFEQLKLKAVLFDMDGVLFDSMPAHAKAWSRAMSEYDLPFAEIDAYLNEGQPAADTINKVFKRKHGRDSTEEERAEIYGVKVKYFDAYGDPKRMPFALDFLELLKEKGFTVGVVTGSAQPLLLKNIETYFPGIFKTEHIVSAFDVKRGKPFPDPYLKSLNTIQLKPWEAVVIENAPFGVKASSAAQIYTIGVNTGPIDKSILLDNGADVVFDSMEELFRNWEKFEFI